MSMTTAPLAQPDLIWPEGFEKAHLAAELACDIHELDDILKRHLITREHLRALTEQREFQMMLEQYQRDWNSPMNAQERIKLKASLAAEDGLVDLYAIFKNADFAPNARLDAYKQITTLADAIPKRNEGEGGGSGFSITINVGKSTGDEPRGVVIEGSTELDPED